LEKYGKDSVEKIKELDRIAKEKFGYGYGQIPPKNSFKKADTTQQLSFAFLDEDIDLPDDFEDTPNLCVGCLKPEPDNETLDEIMSNRLEW
jgi:hypothetical protein